MTSIVQATVRKSHGGRKVLGLGCVSSMAKSFGRGGENGGKFYTFCEEGIAELLPKIMAKNSKRTTSRMTTAEKRDARAKLLFYQSKPVDFLPYSLPSPS